MADVSVTDVEPSPVYCVLGNAATMVRDTLPVPAVTDSGTVHANDDDTRAVPIAAAMAAGGLMSVSATPVASTVWSTRPVTVSLALDSTNAAVAVA